MQQQEGWNDRGCSRMRQRDDRRGWVGIDAGVKEIPHAITRIGLRVAPSSCIGH